MYKDLSEAKALASEIAKGLSDGVLPPAKGGPRRVAIFPAAVALAAVAEAVRPSKHQIWVGAQNMYCEKEGAFTGEISAEMIVSAGGRCVILGHSERRHVFGEPDALIGKKVVRALQANLVPVLCVGEKIEEREAQKTMEVVSRQLSAGLAGVREASDLSKIIIAYEPVWAIGTGKTATPQQGEEVQKYLRSELAKAFRSLDSGTETAEDSLILYGGSVKPENAGELLSEPNIDGLLVGGASLKGDSFVKICKAGM